ncbi:MAG: tetratricopeptide repeat protein [Micrococcales bacterium]|nr:tetratricopeptide repeat protein [Micrococcales bacterium]
MSPDEPAAGKFAGSSMPDLAAKKPEEADAVQPASEGSSFVIAATDATFAALIEQSTMVPVVVDLWADWCGPCKQLTPVLEKLAAEFAGRFLLAKVNIDENPQVAKAFQVQSIPLVIALVKGQPVPLFAGAQGEAQVRAVLTELMAVAAKNGVTGTASSTTDLEAEPPLPPLHAEALEAIDRGDYDAAVTAFARALKENPADVQARIGLAQVRLLSRVEKTDGPAALAAARTQPLDVDTALAAADIEVASNAPKAAFDRLLAIIRATRDEPREKARVRLVEYFDIVGIDHPDVAAARRSLAAALF